MKKQIIFITIIALCFEACTSNQKPVDLTQTTANKTSKYDTVHVSARALSGFATLPGELKPFNEVNIFPKINGFVKALYVDRGTVVKKGQLLLTLEAPEIESGLQAANSKFMQAQENAAASKEKCQRLKQAAAEPGSVSPLELDNALSKMKADEAMAQAERSEVASVQALHNYQSIRAPFAGMIVLRNISPGALVSPGKVTDQPMLVLQDINRQRLEVSIPEDYVNKVDLSIPVKFTFNAMPGAEHTARISRSANSLGNMRSEAIEIDVDNNSGALKPGMYAEVKIPLLSGVRSLSVLNSCIVRSTEREYVIVVKSGRAQFVDVKTGLESQNSTEVYGDLQAGDIVLKNANDEIKQGDLIQ